MFTLSMKLLRNEYKKALLFGITTTLATTIIFLYLNVFYVLQDIVAKTSQFALLIAFDAGLIVVFLITCLCCAMLLLASSYYLTGKSKEYATLMLCGKNAIEVGIYSVIQCIIIVGLAILLGAFISYPLIPIINQEIYSFLAITDTLPSISPNAIRETSYIIILIFIITILMFSGYAYRHTILQLLVNEKTSMGMRQKRSKKLLSYLYPFLFLPILITNSSDSFMFPMVFCAIAIYHIYNTELPRIIKDLRKENGLANSTKLLSLAHLGSTMQSCSISRIMIVIMPVFLALLQSSYTTPREFIVIFIGFQVVMLLLSVSLLYQYMSSIQNRKHTFDMLPKLGYTKRVLKRSIRQEIFLFYALLILLSSIFPVFMLCKVSSDIILFNTIGICIISYIILMLFSYVCIERVYLRILK